MCLEMPWRVCLFARSCGEGSSERVQICEYVGGVCGREDGREGEESEMRWKCGIKQDQGPRVLREEGLKREQQKVLI